jgi:hypothetical protein
MKREGLRNTRNLKELQVQVDEDFPLETRRIGKNLIPCLKDAEKFGIRAFYKKDKLAVEG